MSLVLPVGEDSLEPGDAGLAVLAGDALEGGTASRSGSELAEALEGIGATPERRHRVGRHHRVRSPAWPTACTRRWPSWPRWCCARASPRTRWRGSGTSPGRPSASGPWTREPRRRRAASASSTARGPLRAPGGRARQRRCRRWTGAGSRLPRGPLPAPGGRLRGGRRRGPGRGRGPGGGGTSALAGARPPSRPDAARPRTRSAGSTWSTGPGPSSPRSAWATRGSPAAPRPPRPRGREHGAGRRLHQPSQPQPPGGHGYTYGVRSRFSFRRGAGPFSVSTAVGTEVTADGGPGDHGRAGGHRGRRPHRGRGAGRPGLHGRRLSPAPGDHRAGGGRTWPSRSSTASPTTTTPATGSGSGPSIRLRRRRRPGATSAPARPRCWWWATPSREGRRWRSWAWGRWRSTPPPRRERARPPEGGEAPGPRDAVGEGPGRLAREPV